MQGACALGVLGLVWWLTQSIVTPPAALPVIIQNVTLTVVQAGQVYARERFAYGQATRVTP